MLLKRYYDEQLAQASYLIACEGAGEALIVDPHRDVQFYIDNAAREGVRITHVTETHIHADFVSGSRELASATGANLLLSSEGGQDWQYGFASSANAKLLRDGDEFSIGRISVRALHTPGHTPEHLSFLVTDSAVSDEPLGLLSGDFIFVGDVGRPDLLERAARQKGTMEAAAHALFSSLRRMSSLPDHLQIWPGHGAGSACGKALGSMPQTTLGYERISNWAFRTTDEALFVQDALAGQPTPPRYFARMKTVNREGPAIIGGIRSPERISVAAAKKLMDEGGTLLDARTQQDYGTGHIPLSLSVPFNKSFTKWAGSVLDAEHSFVVLIPEGRADMASRIARDLVMIGFDGISGFLESSDLQGWRDQIGPLDSSAEINAKEAAALLDRGDANVVDVRDEHEFAAGHLEEAKLIPLSLLSDRVAEVPRDKPLIVYCQGGGRSAIAASVLEAAGVKDVINMTGGFAAWQRSGGTTAESANNSSGV